MGIFFCIHFCRFGYDGDHLTALIPDTYRDCFYLPVFNSAVGHKNPCGICLLVDQNGACCSNGIVHHVVDGALVYSQAV